MAGVLLCSNLTLSPFTTRFSPMSHYPVMLADVLESLNPTDGEVYVDGTFGAGGYAAAILERADCTVVAIDRDVDAAARAEAMQEKYGDRLVFIHGCFGDVQGLLKSTGFDAVDGFVLDLGVSSFQIDEVGRGFSFRFDGPLDMRMDVSRGETAADIVNAYDEGDLADLIYLYGEERKSRRVARAIVQRRAEQKFETTEDLANVVRGAVPRSRGHDIDGATRTFQALRIAVNDELGELERALDVSEDILNPGGRLVVVSFHSLEDGRVKRFLRDKSGGENVSRHLPQVENEAAVFDLPQKKAFKPSKDELSENARSRSARMRVAVRTKAGGAL